MNRRKFLGNSALLTVPLMLQGIPVFAGDGALHPLLQSLTQTAANCGKVLVIIQLNGGNDGLNMVIPFDRGAELAVARPDILIPSNQVLTLNGNTTTGLNPGMGSLKNLYNEGKVSIVQAVSYPNPNFSHFQAQDIWFSGTNTNPTGNTGWLGRQLDTSYPGFPNGYPNASEPDPIAIQIGGTLPLSLQGPNINMAYNVPNPDYLVSVATASPAAAPVSDYGTELTFLRLMKDQSNAYTARISAAYNAQQTLSTQYGTNGDYNNDYLANQLKIVARLIGGGLNTSVYIVNHGFGFDTHENQVVAGNTATGYHANILKILSDSIAGFMNDITLMGKADKVAGMTYSEFGRRVIQNSSKGTDHGSGAPIIFFGTKVNSGVIGTSPILPLNPDGNTQVPMQYDYRQIYATVMKQWFCMSNTQSQTILNGVYNTVPVFNTGILPITGVELSANWDGNFAKLHFEVAQNYSYDSFVIERSTNGIVFNAVKTITNISSIDQEVYNYKEDRIRANDVFYRIKGISKVGVAPIFSNIIRLINMAEQSIRVYPNPVINFTINIEFVKPLYENVSITIIGTNGEKLFYNQINPHGNKVITFKVPDYFNVHTLYVMKVEFGSTVVNEKLVFE